MIDVGGELNPIDDMRGGEWRCRCIKGIRAASCRQCTRCGEHRPMDTNAVRVLTQQSILAVDVFEKSLRQHGSRTAAMGDVILWLRSRGLAT